MSKEIKVFGAALDPSDTQIKISLKQSYLNALTSGNKEKYKYLDAYDAFIDHSKYLKLPIFKKIGKFPIESWLRPKPDLEDFQFMNPLDFRIFLDGNGCKEYSDEIERFIEKKVLPDIPLMIGADHSLTGGVLNVLSDKFGAKDITLIILDGHFDGIPSKLRLDLAKYSKEHKEEIGTLFPELVDSINENLKIPRTYNCGTFLSYLIEEGKIKPENLIVFGCMDYPRDEFRSIQDPRVKNYVDFYLSYEKKGVKFIPNSGDNEKMKMHFEQALQSINTPYVYVSIDVDVGALNAILASRFYDYTGVDEECLYNAAESLKNFIHTKKVELVGLDIMEVETYFLNVKLKKFGKTDNTIEIMDKFLEILL
ncbi:MAG: arginase family protein [Candidatus Hodarchaeota archaeon]